MFNLINTSFILQHVVLPFIVDLDLVCIPGPSREAASRSSSYHVVFVIVIIIHSYSNQTTKMAQRGDHRTVVCLLSDIRFTTRVSQIPHIFPFLTLPSFFSVFSSESVYGDVRGDILNHKKFGTAGTGCQHRRGGCTYSNVIVVGVVVVGCLHDGWCSFGCCCCH